MSASHLCTQLRVRHDELVERLVRYYDPDGGFSGREFDPSDASQLSEHGHVTEGDLASLAKLSVTLKEPARSELLRGETHERLEELLLNIAVNQDLHSFESNPLTPDSAAWQAWNILVVRGSKSENMKGFGAVRASKLLARKRPHLIPIYDQVIGCVFGFKTPAGHWQWMYETLIANDYELVNRLKLLRVDGAAAIPRISQISLLRILDVVVWMDHQSVHPTGRSSSQCPTPQPWG